MTVLRARPRETEDAQATAELTAAGWTVLRAREAPLAAVTDHDLLVYPGESTKRIAASIVNRLVDLGFDVPRAADYIADPQKWAASSRRATARLTAIGPRATRHEAGAAT